MPFFTVNFGIKTKMPSTVINKKNIKKKIYIFFKKKQKNKNLRGWLAGHSRPLGVAARPP
jgi:hypothetical protein